MVQKKAQFDDRIRNLLALAEDGSVESRTLLFSHICDLFLQDRPMESDNQVRMLIEIINELISDVEISIRNELSNILLSIDNPPEELIKLMSEDVIEVSAKILEEAVIEDEQLLYLIKYASDDHREHIGRRFGLSPIMRRELEKARHEKNHVVDLVTKAENKKISLQELEEAEQNSTELNEDVTANILEVLRSKKNEVASDLSIIHSTDLGEEPSADSIDIEPLIDDSTVSPQKTISLTAKIIQKDVPEKSEIDFVPIHSEEVTPEVPQENELLLEDEIVEDEVVEDATAANDALVEPEEWFWEIDRYGNIKYLSENAENVFLQVLPSMNGEDFLCLWRRKGASINDPNDFIALFEKRQAFRDEEFVFEITPNLFQAYFISAVATFDLDTGRFTGFRGSALPHGKEFEISASDLAAEHEDDELILTSPLEDSEQDDTDNHRPQFSGEIVNVTDQGQKSEISEETSDLSNENSDSNNQDEVASEMLHNLSHEFRTPLNAIIGFSQMIDNEMWGPVSKRYRRNTKDIINAANHLKEAVNNILDSAKMEAGLIEPSPESFSLKAVIQDSMDAVAPILETKELSVSGIDDNIDVILYNDKHCIMLCLIKIITFAIKNAEGGEDLHISVLVNSSAQVRIEIPLIKMSVDEEQASDLFQKTHTLLDDNKTTSNPNSEFETKISSGFGLSVAQDIAKLIGGELSTLSNEGKVSHIVLTISTYPI